MEVGRKDAFNRIEIPSFYVWVATMIRKIPCVRVICGRRRMKPSPKEERRISDKMHQKSLCIQLNMGKRFLFYQRTLPGSRFDIIYADFSDHRNA